MYNRTQQLNQKNQGVKVTDFCQNFQDSTELHYIV